MSFLFVADRKEEKKKMGGPKECWIEMSRR